MAEYSSFPKWLNEASYGYIHSWEKYKERFHEITPKASDIQSNYIKAKTHFSTLVNSSQYSTLLRELQLSANSPIALDPYIEQQVINKIQNMGNLWGFVSKNKTAPMAVSQDEAKKIYNGWQEILKMAALNQWQSVDAQLDRIKILSDNLLAAIDNSSELISMNEVLGFNGNTKSSTIANSIQGTLSALRGAVLEEEVKKFLSKRLPKNSKVKTYQAGAIKVGGQSIKEDLITLLNSLELTDENGNVNYIFKNGDIFLADGITKTKTVNLTKYELNQLRNAPGLGFTAKTSKGQTVFHGGYNINTLLDDSIREGANADMIHQLGHFYQLGISHKLNLYQSYAVSKLVIEILGTNNAFMISRSNIIPTYQYIESLLNKNKYLSFSNKSIGKRSANAPLVVKYGSTNIVGPHI